ncbi:MAG: hypothetical protein HW415_1759 [Deltaproteobacteria bacterium]|nr:hypothetical protein [Deltaproteobacteria bacterium]
MSKFKQKFLIGIVLFMLLLMLIGCSQSTTAPSGGTITFAPASHTQAGIASNTIVTFTVTVKDSNGKPMNKAKLMISGPFAVPRTPVAYYQFYRGNNATGGAVNSGFEAETDEFGAYTFSVIIDAAASAGGFADYIAVYSGTNYGSAALSVT